MLTLFRILRHRHATPTHGMFDTFHQDFRVGLMDIDLNLHLNNARYLKYLDRARLEHLLATGLLWRMLNSRSRSVVANTEISYIRELRTWQPFTVTVRIAGWDEKYFYFEQRFISNGQLCTHVFMRLVHLKNGKGISSAEALAQLGIDATSPPLPEPVLRWREMLAAKRDFARQTSG